LAEIRGFMPFFMLFSHFVLLFHRNCVFLHVETTFGGCEIINGILTK
jgi:hypothetical protein